MVVITALAATGVPLRAMAAESDPTGLMGTAYKVNMQPLSNAEIQIRNLKTGSRVNTTVSDAAGEFSFKNVQPGTYIVEIVDATGKVLGMSAPFVFDGAATVNVSVVAVAQGGTAASGQSAGFSLLGLGPVASLAVIGAAGATAVTAVVATRPDASPSR